MKVTAGVVGCVRGSDDSLKVGGDSTGLGSKNLRGSSKESFLGGVPDLSFCSAVKTSDTASGSSQIYNLQVEV